ncbi:44113_t:CDS:2 [Gigaspora margarita]|uniref:44113_t:CDS:1 n=1 Tax=Gigaspora margarita TaxID=4874 RepID=A0ABN7V7L6_GIGMA|nr:44113_t:CDS:2 [Gigaspora margarita]
MLAEEVVKDLYKREKEEIIRDEENSYDKVLQELLSICTALSWEKVWMQLSNSTEKTDKDEEDKIWRKDKIIVSASRLKKIFQITEFRGMVKKKEDKAIAEIDNASCKDLRKTVYLEVDLPGAGTPVIVPKDQSCKQENELEVLLKEVSTECNTLYKNWYLKRRNPSKNSEVGLILEKAKMKK